MFTISQERLDRLGAAPSASRPSRCRTPPQALDFPSCESYDDSVRSVDRFDRAKRIDLLIEARGDGAGAAHHRGRRRSDRGRLEQLTADRGLNGRVSFAGRVSAISETAGLYATCRAVFYAPVDED